MREHNAELLQDIKAQCDCTIITRDKNACVQFYGTALGSGVRRAVLRRNARIVLRKPGFKTERVRVFSIMFRLLSIPRPGRIRMACHNPFCINPFHAETGEKLIERDYRLPQM